MKGVDSPNHGGGKGLFLPAVGGVPGVDQGCSVKISGTKCSNEIIFGGSLRTLDHRSVNVSGKKSFNKKKN